MKKILITIIALGAIFISCEGGKSSKIRKIVAVNADDSVTIAFAKLIAHDMLKIENLDLNVELFNQTFEEFYSKEGRVTSTVLQDAYTNVQNYLFNIAPKRQLEEQKKYIEQLKLDEAILKTDSGLYYTITKAGEEDKIPSVTDSIKVKYTGKTIGGHEFYNTDKDATSNIKLDKAIKGWQEGVPLIGKGGHVILYIPSELAYGSTGEFANQMLIFDIELIDIITKVKK